MRGTILLLCGLAFLSLLVSASVESEAPTPCAWPWTSWLHGPPCPKRPQPPAPLNLNDPTLRQAVDEVRGLCNLSVQQMKALNIDMGVSAALVYDQEVLFSEGFGSVRKHQNAPPTDDTIFGIGSVTKIFTSLGLFHAVQRGDVSLDDPVTKYFNAQQPPAFEVRNPYSQVGAAAVTLASLAAQSSGLPREPYCGVLPISPTCQIMEDAAQLNMDQLRRFDLLYSPFSNAHYSNLGLALLGRSLERAWGQPYEEYMVNELFAPLNMTSSGFNYTQAVVDRMAMGYVVEQLANGTYITVPTPAVNRLNWGWGAPAGGMYTSRADMVAFMKWVLAQDAEASDPVMARHIKAQYLSAGMNLPDGISQYGQGTWESFYTNKYWAITKGGLTTSMAASLAFVPKLKLGLVLMCNINSGSLMDSLSAQSFNVLIPALSKLLDAPYKHPLPANYQALLGSYGGPSAAQPYVTIESNADTPSTGILVGQLSVQGKVQFIWDPNSNPSEGMVAFRYPGGSNVLQSCMATTGNGDALLYIDASLSTGPLATLPDQNGNFYNMTRWA